MSDLGAHVKPNPAEAVPREVHRRRMGDAVGDHIRMDAIRSVFDECVDRGERLSLAQIESICRRYEAIFRALGGGW